MDKTEIQEASKHIWLWRNIYNSICMNCKTKLFRAATDIKKVGTEVVADRIKLIVDEKFCTRCKHITDKLLEEYDAK